MACGAAAVIAASEPREGDEGERGRGREAATGVVMFLGQQHRGGGARCSVRLFFVSVVLSPSVRLSARSFDGPSDVRLLCSQCPFNERLSVGVRSPLLFRTAVRAVKRRSENREERGFS